jgi:lysophospholipase L1-like esterase
MRGPLGSQPFRVLARGRVAPARAIVALLMLALPMTRAAAQTAPLRLSMFGDSVMLGARDQLLGRFPDASVTVDAVENRSLLGAVSVLQAAQPLGDVVVLDLGYNDADDPAGFRQRIDAAMAVLSAVPKVIWLNQREFKAGRAGMNAELAAATARYGNLDVVDWNAEVTAHPEDVYGDGIHLTPAGQSAMAGLVRQRFDAYAAARTPATTATTTTTAPTTAPRASAPIEASGRTALAGAGSTTDESGLAAFGLGGVLVVTGGVLLFARRWFAGA